MIFLAICNVIMLIIRSPAGTWNRKELLQIRSNWIYLMHKPGGSTQTMKSREERSEELGIIAGFSTAAPDKFPVVLEMFVLICKPKSKPE